MTAYALLSKYRFWILIVCSLLLWYKTPAFGDSIGTKIGDLLQYMTVGQLSFPLVSSVSALLYARCILHSASLLRLSVHLSVRRSLVKCVLGVARSLCGSWASCWCVELWGNLTSGGYELVHVSCNLLTLYFQKSLSTTLKASVGFRLSC